MLDLRATPRTACAGRIPGRCRQQNHARPLSWPIRPAELLGDLVRALQGGNAVAECAGVAFPETDLRIVPVSVDAAGIVRGRAMLFRRASSLDRLPIYVRSVNGRDACALRRHRHSRRRCCSIAMAGKSGGLIGAGAMGFAGHHRGILPSFSATRKPLEKRLPAPFLLTVLFGHALCRRALGRRRWLRRGIRRERLDQPGIVVGDTVDRGGNLVRLEQILARTAQSGPPRSSHRRSLHRATGRRLPAAR